jgi:IS5 family transposase
VALRLLVLKELRQWSYEQLEWEVTGNLVYRRFCRIDAGKVPDAKTLIRLGQLLAGPVLRALFERCVAIAVERKVTRGRKMRVDTTVTEAPIRYPTDSGLCEDAIRVLDRSMRHLEEQGAKLPFARRRVTLSVSRRMREIGQALRLRGDRAREAIKKPYKRLLRITARVVRQAKSAADAAARLLARAPRRRKGLRRALEKIERVLPLAERVVRQTRLRIVGGVTDSKVKLVSIFEPHARIIRKGKVHRPTEFGVMVKVQEAEGGVVTDLDIAAGTNDAPLLVDSIDQHIKVFGASPRLLATDRGFHSLAGVAHAQAVGIRCIAVPKPGYRSRAQIQHEQTRPFRRGRAWRAGGEARIARLKHRFGMARSRYKGESGMWRTVYWAGIANNLVAIARAG